jgi:hypothetical protein
MNNKFSVLVGVSLILMGLLALAFTLLAPLVGLGVWHWGPWRLWPLTVVCVGLLFVLPPFLVRGQRGLGGLFIPGVPVLVTGGILLFCSVFDAWGAWAWLWPLEVLAVAVAFVLAAITMRVIWLLIPAFIVGANGLLLQFCAITGLWVVWAALWTIEPLSLGLAFLLIGAVKRIGGLSLAGMILCGIAGMGLIGMTAILSGWWLINLLGPIVLVLVGVAVLVWGLVRRPAIHASQPSQ